MATPKLTLNRAQKIAINFLKFDEENPRFAIDRYHVGDADNEFHIIQELYENADLRELIESIASNGYIDIEPLIVGPFEDFYIVFEGNRRLAALKLLRDPTLTEKVGAKLPEIADGVKESLNEVTVYLVGSRKDARAFIGFKHVNGPHTWDSFAKGRFAADWYKSEKDNGVKIKDIARNLGDRHDTVHRLVQGIYVLDQAEEKEIFHVNDRYPGRQFSFSHLYTALTRSGYRQYLGLNPNWKAEDPKPNPVPKTHLEKLRNVLTWLYGSKSEDIRPVIKSQNPDIKRLSEVVSDSIARMAMEQTGDLKKAYAEIDTGERRLEQAIVQAYQSAKEAEGHVSSFDGDDHALVEVAGKLRRSAVYIHKQMTSEFQKRQSGENSEDDNGDT